MYNVNTCVYVNTFTWLPIQNGSFAGIFEFYYMIFLSHATIISTSPCAQMTRIIEEYLDDYNQISTAQMKLVLFLDAVKHVNRISRIIRQPLGNALLLSLTRLDSHMYVTMYSFLYRKLYIYTCS